jgi:hypothetical protein
LLSASVLSARLLLFSLILFSWFVDSMKFRLCPPRSYLDAVLKYLAAFTGRRRSGRVGEVPVGSRGSRWSWQGAADRRRPVREAEISGETRPEGKTRGETMDLALLIPFS